MPTAIIMAGGRSLRMRASSGQEHKALVEVLGVPMLERNLLTLLSHGFDTIYLAISAEEKSLLAFAGGRAFQLARAVSAQVKIFVERQRLGTIGAARAIRSTADDLLVVNVDNLTSLDLSALMKHHRAKKAAMTIATHFEQFQVPFGQVFVEKGRVVDYREKPLLPVLLSSGTYVLSKEARQRIPLRQPFGAPDLAQLLLTEKRKVESFFHSSPWIDVNTSSVLDQAEKLIGANFREFELWRHRPEREVAILCVVSGTKVATIEGRKHQILPTMRLLTRKSAPLEAAANLLANIHMRVTKLQRLVSFDELDSRSRGRTRYHIFVARSFPMQARYSAPGKVRWIEADELSSIVPDLHGRTRTIEYLRRHIASQDSHLVRN